MSRGWESKNVEQQQAAAAEPLTPESGKEALQDRAQDRASDADRKRRRQELELQRERILSERTSSPHRRSALELALADIEEKLAELGWSIHL